MEQQRWQLGGREWSSRLILGTARYASRRSLLDSLEASGTEIVTVAIRRVGLESETENLYEVLREHGYQLLPNTAGCYTARDAVLTAGLAREAVGVAARYRSRLILAPGEVKRNIERLADLIDEIDRTS